MSKNKILGGVIALALVVVLASSIVSYEWDMGDEANPIPFGPDDDGTLSPDSINYQMFEVWGPVLLALGTLMFGAIIAGVCISKEDDEKEEEE